VHGKYFFSDSWIFATPGYVFLVLGIFLAGGIIGAFGPKGKIRIEVMNTTWFSFFSWSFMLSLFSTDSSGIETWKSLLHLPIGKGRIISMLLVRSFISAMRIIPFYWFLKHPASFQIIQPSHAHQELFFGLERHNAWQLEHLQLVYALVKSAGSKMGYGSGGCNLAVLALGVRLEATWVGFNLKVDTDQTKFLIWPWPHPVFQCELMQRRWIGAFLTLS